MKKISLILALAMLLGICAFAFSCTTTPTESSEEPAPATSSEAPAPAESSEEPAPAESSEEPAPAESSEEPAPAESSEDEPAPAESSEDEPTPAEPSEDEPETSEDTPSDNGNLALNKPYTRSDLFRMGGADVGWGWDPNAPDAYPDEGGVSLTDGAKVPETDEYGDPVWAGFNTQEPTTGENGYAFIRVDLGEKKSLKKFVMYVGSMKIGSGVAAPNGFEVFVSDDGKDFESVGSVNFEDGDKEAYVSAQLKKSCKGRYVEFRINPKGYWMFVSEVEVY